MPRGIPSNMEAGMVERGHWKVEGYDVKKSNNGSGHQLWWIVMHGDRHIGKRNTLTEACYLIDDDMVERKARGDD